MCLSCLQCALLVTTLSSSAILPVCTLRCLQDSVVIGARFDVDAAGEACRLAFYGRLTGSLAEGGPQQLRKLQVYKVRRQPVCTVCSDCKCLFFSGWLAAWQRVGRNSQSSYGCSRCGGSLSALPALPALFAVCLHCLHCLQCMSSRDWLAVWQRVGRSS